MKTPVRFELYLHSNLAPSFRKKKKLLFTKLSNYEVKGKESYPLHFSENSEKVESGQLLQILNGPHPTGQETGEELGIFRNVFEAGRNAEINK